MDTLIASTEASIGIAKGSPMPVAVSANEGADTFTADWIAPVRVSGFLVPYFTREEAEKVIDWIMVEPYPGERIAWDVETEDYVLTIDNTAYTYHYPTVWRGQTKLHGIGAEEFSWLAVPATLAPSEIHPDEWAEATARACEWIMLQSLFDWEELAAGVDPGLVLERQGFYARFGFPDAHPFWDELIDYLRGEIEGEVARARATHGGE